MKVIVISPPNPLPNEVDIVCQLFEAGLMHYHLRKPNYSKGEILDYLLEIPEFFLDRIVLHQFHSFGKIFNLKGIHLPEEVRISQYFPINTPLISTSFHASDDLLVDKTPYQYVFLSPIFDSISKPGYRAAFEEDNLRAVLQKTTQSVIALGGVEASKIKKVKDMGFKGVALLGAIWKSEDPLAEFEKVQELLDK